jgi:hypothetical protein
MKNLPNHVYPALEQVKRPAITTEEAAHYLNRRPQTLRGWACHENGPLRPLRIHGRLAWSVTEIRALLGGAA